MTQIYKRLALHIPLGDREPGFSYLSRLGRFNGVCAGIFAQEQGMTFAQVIEGNAEALERLANLGGIDLDALTAWTPIYLGNGVHSFRGENFHARALMDTQFRGCPVCIAEDAAADKGGPWIRADWLLRHVTHCPKHECSLIPLWHVPQRYERFDVAARMAEWTETFAGGDPSPEYRESTDFDDWLQHRLQHGRGDDWLGQFDLYPATHFCELLGRARIALEGLKPRHTTADSAWAFPALGYEIARHGEARVRATLTLLQERDDSPTAGPKAKFGDLYDRLAHDLDADAYRPFRDLLRDHIATTWPLGPGDELLGEPVLHRRLHSVVTAAREIGIDSRRLRKLLTEAGLIAADDTGKSDAWQLFDAETAAPFLASLAEFVSAKDIQRILGISRSQFILLRKSGHLEPAISGADHKPLWRRDTGIAWLHRLMTGAMPLIAPGGGQWVDIGKAAQRLKVLPGVIVDLIFARRLIRVARVESKAGYDGMQVDLREVAGLIKRPDSPGLTIDAFAKSVGLKPGPARRLVVEKHIPSTRARNPVTKAEQDYLGTDDIAAFHARFVTLRELAQELGRSWQGLIVELRDAGVSTFGDDGYDYGPLYTREDVEAWRKNRPGA